MTYLTFNGYHAVYATSDILNRYHIDNRIVRAPIDRAKQGCSFAVLINGYDEEMAVSILKSKGIQIQ